MNLLLSFFVVVTVSLLSSLAFSADKKVLIISDIDDTLKVSHVLNPIYAASRIPNYTVRFTGMSQLYQLLSLEQHTETRFAYISNAPKEIVGVPVMLYSHLTFLQHNNFPSGVLSLRENFFDKNHKIDEIRHQVALENPDVIIFIGDNGQSDSEIYHQATAEFKQKNIKMITFIHQVYKTEKSFLDISVISEIGNKLLSEQIGYVTPIEIALELNQKGLMSQRSMDWMITNVAPSIANEKFYNSDSINNITFPSFQNCSEFTWRWPIKTELVPLVKKIKSVCHKLF